MVFAEIAPESAAEATEFGFHHIGNANGVSIAVAGIVIVFIALALISGFIGSLPRLLGMLGNVFPEVEHHHHSHHQPAAAPASAPISEVDRAVVAAIGYALHVSQQGTTKH